MFGTWCHTIGDYRGSYSGSLKAIGPERLPPKRPATTSEAHFCLHDLQVLLVGVLVIRALNEISACGRVGAWFPKQDRWDRRWSMSNFYVGGDYGPSVLPSLIRTSHVDARTRNDSSILLGARAKGLKNRCEARDLEHDCPPTPKPREGGKPA